MDDLTEVSTGEVEAASEGVLKAGAIGSCVAVAAYDPKSGVAAMAHVMLPGQSCDYAPSTQTRYAANAIDEMMRKMATLGAVAPSIRVCLVGGGNVLGDGHDSPGPEIVQSIFQILGEMGIIPEATVLGGTSRRSCTLDVSRRRVTYTVGDSSERTLWDAAVNSADPNGDRHASSCKEATK